MNTDEILGATVGLMSVGILANVAGRVSKNLKPIKFKPAKPVFKPKSKMRFL
jgi:hypothetical protein